MSKTVGRSLCTVFPVPSATISAWTPSRKRLVRAEEFSGFAKFRRKSSSARLDLSARGRVRLARHRSVREHDYRSDDDDGVTGGLHEAIVRRTGGRPGWVGAQSILLPSRERLSFSAATVCVCDVCVLSYPRPLFPRRRNGFRPSSRELSPVCFIRDIYFQTRYLLPRFVLFDPAS